MKANIESATREELIGELSRRGIAVNTLSAEEAALAVNQDATAAFREWFERNRQYIQVCMRQAGEGAVSTFLVEDGKATE